MPATLTAPGAAPFSPAIAEDEPLYEIINGQHVELPPMSAYASVIASILGGELFLFAHTHPLGRALVEVLFRLPLNSGQNRRPDAAFVSYQRWPLDRPMAVRDNAWDVVPDLAVEVVSPNDFADEVMKKIVEYFQAGVQLVWVIYPQQRLVHIYESLTRIHVRQHTDELDGGAVLPGFRLPLATLFPEAASS